MTTIYDQQWPSSYVDQKHQADLLLERAKILYARKVAITVVRYNTPSQGDWENAYVTKTGLPLPIPVGTELLWKSLKSGRVIQFGTINDSNNGLASTGTVFPLLNMNYTQPAFRFLGLYDSNRSEGLVRKYINSPQYMIPALTWLPSGSFIFGIQMGQIYYWMTQGLESLMLVYRCRTADLIATPSPAINLYFNRGGSDFQWGFGGSDIFESSVSQMPGSATTAALLGAGVGSVSSGAAGAPIMARQTASDSAANAYSYGTLYFHNVTQQLEPTTTPDYPRENYHNPAVWGIGSYFGATLTEANSFINIGAAIKEDNGYSWIDFMELGVARPVSGTGLQSAKLWAYGIFKNATGELSE